MDKIMLDKYIHISKIIISLCQKYIIYLKFKNDNNNNQVSNLCAQKMYREIFYSMLFKYYTRNCHATSLYFIM